ncbi:hypothetical protein Pelo_3620 [Pelomyxa schiedti]|nr:hypothetical protein Pelo_3620 [Pelomyxa schiedti]
MSQDNREVLEENKPRPRRVSCGSEAEIRRSMVVNTRPLVWFATPETAAARHHITSPHRSFFFFLCVQIRVEISRPLCEFGQRPVKFGDSDPLEGAHECPPFNTRSNAISLLCDAATQAGPISVDAFSQTPWFRRLNASTNTQPLEMSAEEQATSLHSAEMIQFLAKVVPLYVATGHSCNFQTT